MKIIEIGAAWCGPCRMIQGELDKLTVCDVERIDVENEDDDPRVEELVTKFNVRNIPLIVLVDVDENEIKRWTGFMTANELIKEIEAVAND